MPGLEEKSKVSVKSTEDIAEDVQGAVGALFAHNNAGNHQSWAEYLLSCHSRVDQNVIFLEVRLNKP